MEAIVKALLIFILIGLIFSLVVGISQIFFGHWAFSLALGAAVLIVLAAFCSVFMMVVAMIYADIQPEE